VFQTRLHQLFVVSVALKGLHALVELAGGVALYLFSTGRHRPLAVGSGAEQRLGRALRA